MGIHEPDNVEPIPGTQIAVNETPSVKPCLGCGVDVYTEEFSDPRDADICGYCFSAEVSQTNAVGMGRYVAADIQIRMRDARDKGKDEIVAVYEQMLRLVEATNFEAQ